MAGFNNKNRPTATKPQAVADHDRILAGNPFTLKDVVPERMTMIPPPMDERECRERPAPEWEKRGINTATGCRFVWFHPEYAIRSAMWQYQIRPDAVREQFNDPRIKD